MTDGRTVEDFELDETFESGGRTVTEADIRLFVGATGATHPTHVDEEFCETHPIVDRAAAQGVLSLGVADGFVTDEVTSHTVAGMNYGYDEVRFLQPVYPGDTLSSELVVVDIDHRDDGWGVVTVDLAVDNQEGETVLAGTQKLLVISRDHPDIDSFGG